MDIWQWIKATCLALMSLMGQTAGALPAEQPDTVATEPASESGYRFRSTQLVLPASLIAVGTFGVYNGAFRQLDRYVRKELGNLRGDHYTKVDNYLWTLPVAAYLGLDYVGVKARHSFKERFAAGATAYIVMAPMVKLAKCSFREMRPDGSDNHSFPSGHTANIFTGAELVRIEYGTWAGLGAYTVAAGVGFLRLYNDRHWLNDVIAGAGIGILSARIGYWMLPLYQKWFGWNRSSSNTVMSVAPGYDCYGRTPTLSFVCAF